MKSWLSLEISEEMQKELQEYANKVTLSSSQVVREAIRQYLSERRGE